MSDATNPAVAEVSRPGPSPPPTPRSRLGTQTRLALLGAAVGIVCGVAAALFLLLLEVATAARTSNEPLVYLLPVAGLVIGTLYERYGTSVNGGTNLIIDTIHHQGAHIPARMAPMVLAGTVLTHLFGGSAGREGTAVQMGASLADSLVHRLKVGAPLRRQLLLAGVAGGFGAVFGTPIAGALFGLELPCRGRLRHDALVPAVVAAMVGDVTTRALGIVHTPYPAAPFTPVTLPLFGKWILFAVAVAATAVAFVVGARWLKELAQRWMPRLPLRMCAAGLLVVLLWRVAGTSDYLGLGIPVILRAFEDPSLPVHAFAAKLVFTGVTLAGGFLGGEVTPLFFAGATLGNALARLLELPLALGAGVGLAALFGACANTPLALSVMAMELMGPGIFPHAALVCVVAYWLSGRAGIYGAQRMWPDDGVRSPGGRPGRRPGRFLGPGPAVSKGEKQTGK